MSPETTEPYGETPRATSPRSRLSPSDDALSALPANRRSPDERAVAPRNRMQAQITASATQFASTAVEGLGMPPRLREQAEAQTDVLKSIKQVHTLEDALHHLHAMPQPLRFCMECDALLARMTEVNDSDPTAFDTQTFICFTNAIAHKRKAFQSEPLEPAFLDAIRTISAAPASDLVRAVEQSLAAYEDATAIRWRMKTAWPWGFLLLSVMKAEPRRRLQ